MSENSEKYKVAVAGLSAIVEEVPADKWSVETPCSEWTASQLVGHLIAGTHMISGGGADRDADLAALAGSDPKASYLKARDAALAKLTEESLATKVQSPMGEMSLDQLIGMFLVTDVVIHTWDLATAAGLEVTLDPGLVEQTLGALQPIDAMIRMPGVFGPKIEPPGGADMQTKLMCFTGRSAYGG